MQNNPPRLEEQQQPPTPNARARWAIQIGAVDSLKWSGKERLSRLLGKYKPEHSFTHMAQIWCNEDDIPLKDPKTNHLLPSISIRAHLNPGSTCPKTANFSGLRLDPHTVNDLLSEVMPSSIISKFNKIMFKPEELNSPKTKLSLFNSYAKNWSPMPHTEIEPTPVIVGDQLTIEKIWSTYLLRAAEINKQQNDYHLTKRNCHSANAALNAPYNPKTVEEFAKKSPARLGADPTLIQLPEIKEIETYDLASAQRLNEKLSKHNHFLVSYLNDSKFKKLVDIECPERDNMTFRYDLILD